MIMVIKIKKVCVVEMRACSMSFLGGGGGDDFMFCCYLYWNRYRVSLEK